MKIPFVKFGMQYKKIKKEIDRAIQRCLEKGSLILREDVSEFEEKFAAFVGTKYAVSVASGTDALLIALLAAGIQKDDTVITSPYTFWATVEAIIRSGGKVEYTDININDLTMNLQEERGKFIIPVHIGGKVCDMKTIAKIALRKGMTIIEDACQAVGGPNVGKYSDAACFSFYPAKILGCYGDGGAIATNSWRIAERAKELRHHCQKDGEITGVGFTSRLDNIQAAILNVKLKYLPGWLKRRKEIADIYKEGLKNIEGLVLPVSDVWQEYNIRVQKGKREELADYLKKNGIETIIGRYPNMWDTYYGSYAVANDQVLRFPIWPDLTNEEIRYVIKKVNEFLND